MIFVQDQIDFVDFDNLHVKWYNFGVFFIYLYALQKNVCAMHYKNLKSFLFL